MHRNGVKDNYNKFVTGLYFLLLVCKVYPVVSFERHYRKQGVKFARGFSFFTDNINFIKEV